MTYTLVFRISREVWDAMEKGEKTVEYRDNTTFWERRMRMVAYLNQGPAPIRAMFLCGKRKTVYGVSEIRLIFAEQVPRPWDKYVNTEKVWAVELGRRIE